MATEYRHEWKFEISRFDMYQLRQSLSAVCRRDEHAIDGKYHIRSLYFDDLSDKALREKINGVNEREKFRIRFYNFDTSVIHLEKKCKINGVGKKLSANLTKEEAEKIADADYEWMISDGRPLLKDLYVKMHNEGLRPKTVVDYTREPFIFDAGNVRVTLDYDIRTGLLSTDFLNSDMITIPAGGDVILMEVKWDDFLPDIIKDAIALKGVRAGAFSKYAQCRIYG